MATNPSIILGYHPADVPDPLETRVRQQQLRALAGQQQLQQQQVTSGGLDIQQKQQDLQDQQTLKEAYAQAGGDLTKLQGIVAGKVSPKAMMEINQAQLTQREGLAKASDAELGVAKKQSDAIGSASQSLLQQPPEQRPAAFPAIRQGLIDKFHVKPEDVPEQYPGDDWLQLHAHNAQSVQDQITGEFKRRDDQRAQQAAIDKKAHDVAEQNHWTEQDRLRAQELAKNNSVAQLAFAAAKGDQNAKNALDLLKQISIEERKASGGAVINITPAGQNVITDTIQHGGNVSIPRGGAGQVIANAYNQIGAKNEAGNEPPTDLNLERANLAANKGSLGALQKQSDALDAYGAKFIGNLDQFRQIIGKMPDAGSPLLNMPVRMLDQKLLGADVYGRFNVARTVAANEGGRILAGGGNLGGVVSDNARHEIGTLLDKDATLGQWLTAIDQLHKDYDITKKGMGDQIQKIKGRIGGGAQPKSYAATATGANGHKIGTNDNGKTWFDVETGKPIQ